ncbi:MAG: N-acetylglucosamine-6-phosphate deacetylase [Ignavibacteriae bacterium]|nr:N-acetylglucosamine-6-phosphate deacetylase [Ignavibacteriota bacterium]
MKKYLNIFLILIFNYTFVSPQTNQIFIKGISPDNNVPIQIYFQNGVIQKIDTIEFSDVKEKYFIAPGLIDIQINGYLGVDFTGPNLNPNEIKNVVNALYKDGITSFLPTIITSDNARIIENFKVLNEALKNHEVSRSIPGFHLEGPFISPLKGFRGAHLEKYIQKPDWDVFLKYQNAADNRIKLVTVAPEISGAVDFIKKLSENNITVALGHHNGNAEQIEAAVNAGAVLSTHLGNGCANEIDRHNNPIWPQLSNDKLNISIIADGYHLTKDEVRTFYKVKGKEKTILISDELDLAGLEPGEYIRGERKVLLTENVIKFPEEDVLAGAASSIKKGIENMIKFTGCTLSDAVKLATENPAELLKLNSIGKIEVGKRANIILFDFIDGKLVIQKTFVDGELVFDKKL